MNATFGGSGPGGTLSTETRVLRLDDVRSVYWRRPTPYTADVAMPEQAARWAVEETRYGLGGVLASLPGAHYVNHPWRNRDAEYKPAQLATAEGCGFTVPPTLITNDPGQARAFAADQERVIYKPLRETEYTGANGSALTVWMTTSHLNSSTAACATPLTSSSSGWPRRPMSA
ncbi:hypothetical protein [Streptomyces sp. T028]|uniref:hypothetical protein n=1 Tax=Streptomyces sp. T028 TaxID=3394379 RepID=UPI003A84C270